MYSKIPVSKLEVGMFVADIDRPWMDTPFTIQGFIIEDFEQIEQLRRFCQEVTIDRSRSSGEHQPVATKPAATAPLKALDEAPRLIIERRAAPGTQSVTALREPADPPRRSGSSPPGVARAKAMEELVITTRDAEFRPTESGRFQLTPKPHADTGHAPPAAAKAEGGLARSIMGALSRFIRGDGDNVSKEKLDTDVGPVTEPGSPSARPGFIPPAVHLVIYEDAVSVEEEASAASSAVTRTADLVHRIAQDIRAGRTLALPEVEEVISDMVDSMVRNPDALMWVMRLRERDETTYGHGLYASVYLLALGRHLGFPKSQLSQLGTIGLLLDIGKIKLPRNLLEKEGRLTTDEYETVKTHVQLGVELLSESGGLDMDIMTGIAQHHERENGSGYPRGLAGPNISLFGRMAAIADCFAALTNQRPYAEAVSAYDALRSLSGWGGDYFHAPIVEQFIQAVGVFPVGSLVELSTGEIAAVISHNKTRRLKPRVLVITGPDKTRSAHPATMDLLYAPTDANGQSIYIRRGLAAGAFGLDGRDFYVS
ncbi:MAG: HD-GYP domain-containing protein [Burkholderiales bacterium]|nr:HD-GYP domain-containing protein [Burkholderiales bacterium]